MGRLFILIHCQSGGVWAAAVIPQAHRTVEVALGTPMYIDVLDNRQDLGEKFHPDKLLL